MKKRKKHIKVNHYGYLFIAPFFLGIMVFVLYPMINSLQMSFTDWSGFGSYKYIGFDNYIGVFKNPIFYKTIKNTMLVWVLSGIPQIIVALIVAAIMNTKWFRGKGFLKVFYFLPNIVTAVFMGLLFSFLFGWQGGAVNMLLMHLGWISEPIRFSANPTSMILICSGVTFLQWFGYQAIMIDSGMTGISQDIYEAANVDGASGINTFFKITLPLIRPILIYIVVTSLIGGFKLFDIPYSLSNGTGDPGKSLLTMDMYLVNSAFRQNRFGYATALGFMYCIVIIIVTMITRRIMNKNEREAN